jgi:hypothetical protein
VSSKIRNVYSKNMHFNMKVSWKMSKTKKIPKRWKAIMSSRASLAAMLIRVQYTLFVCREHTIVPAQMRRAPVIKPLLLSQFILARLKYCALNGCFERAAKNLGKNIRTMHTHFCKMCTWSKFKQCEQMFTSVQIRPIIVPSSTRWWFSSIFTI